MVLDIDPDDFAEQQIVFLSGLARLAGVPPQDIAIVGIRYGCVIVTLRFASQGSEESDDALFDQLSRVFEGTAEGARPFLDKYDVIRYERTAQLPAAALLPQRSPILAWVHISDIHVHSDDGRVSEALNERTERLADELPRCLRSQHLDPSLLLVTGDIADRGKTTDYQAAREVLRQISNSVPDVGKYTFLVPGNHDVDRDEINANTEAALRERLADADEASLNAIFEPGSPDIEAIAKRQSAFRQFAHIFRWESPSDPDYFAAEVVTVGPSNLRVGLASLNSAMLSTTYAILPKKLRKQLTNLDRDSLAVGRYQLKECQRILKDADIRIALMHHPPASSWFRQPDLWLQRRMLTFFDVVLRGHEHEGTFEDSLRYLSDGPWHVAAPAVDSGTAAFEGFTLGAISAEGALTIWWWRLDGKPDERYILDTSVTDTGFATVQLGTGALSRLRKTIPGLGGK